MGRDGLSKSQAERKLRQLMEDQAVTVRATNRTAVADMGERLLIRLESRGRKPSHVKGARSHLRVHIAPYF